VKEPERITSPYAPDLGEVRAFLERMIHTLRFVELIAAIIAFVARVCEVNGELSKKLAELRRRRPRSESLERLERQLILPLGDLGAASAARPKHDPLIVEATADKYLEHTPVERQYTRFARLGIEIAPQTLGRAVQLSQDCKRAHASGSRSGHSVAVPPAPTTMPPCARSRWIACTSCSTSRSRSSGESGAGSAMISKAQCG